MTVDLETELKRAVYSWRTCIFVGGEHKKILTEYLMELWGESPLINWKSLKRAKALVGVKRKEKRGKVLLTGRDWYIVDEILDDSLVAP